LEQNTPTEVRLQATLQDLIQYHHQVHYRGVPCWKNVMDLWVYQEILWETQVEAVIEIGVKFGGSTRWLSDALRTSAGSRSLVVGIDIAPNPAALPDNVVCLQGNSLDPGIAKAAARYCSGKRTMVIADGNHAADHVLQELRTYSPLVSPGCYFIAEDGIVDMMGWSAFPPGPREAVRGFLSETNEFEIDRRREKFLLTYSPDAFLRRANTTLRP
jgi:cephalosporin hydroxylase